MEFKEVIRKRHSVRSYTTNPVDDTCICQLLDDAHLAPSWMNKQCWHFIVIRDADIKNELAKTGVINRWLKQAPVIIIACADPHESGNKNGMDYYLVDVAIAMDHLVLSATNLGLGTCWIGDFKEEKIKSLCDIPPRIKVVALTPLGYPSKENTIRDYSRKIIVRSTKRKSLQEIVHWDHW